jgi:TonB family protein
MSLYQEFAHWSQWFWPLFSNHLRYTTLFALIAWSAAVLLLKNSPARARYSVWLLTLSKFILPSVFLIYCLEWSGIDLLQIFAGDEQYGFANVEIIFQIAHPFSTAQTITLSDSGMTSAQLEGYALREFYSVLSIVWILGAAVLLIRWAILRRRFAQLILSGMEAATGREAGAFERVKGWMLIKKEIRLVISRHPCQPGVWGIFRPTIILPEGIGERLTDEELEAVMMHELLHALRYDNLLSMIQMLVCCAFWFHPLIWLTDRKLLAEREVICDEDVIRYVGEVRPYAAGLWKVAQFELGWNFAGVSRATGNNLKGRIKHMLDRSNLGPISKKDRTLSIVVTSLLIAVGGGIVLFSHDGVRAQNRRHKQPEPQIRVPGGVPGGVSGGVPGGVPGGIAGGVPDADHERSAEGMKRVTEVSTLVQEKKSTLRPKILYKEKAEYTQKARDRKIEGIVILDVIFGADGKITGIKVLQGLPDGLTEKAIEAAQKIRFEPRMKDGVPVNTRGKVDYTFKLDK